MRCAAFSLLVVFVVVSPFAAADHLRQESADFVGPSLTGGTNVVTMCTAPLNVGDTCFAKQPAETSADVEVRDVLGRPLAAIVRLYDDGFALRATSGNFCGSKDNLALPAASVWVVVQPLDHVNAGLTCAGAPPATVGTVSIGFH